MDMGWTLLLGLCTRVGFPEPTMGGAAVHEGLSWCPAVRSMPMAGGHPRAGPQLRDRGDRSQPLGEGLVYSRAVPWSSVCLALCTAWQQHPGTHPAQLAREVLHFPVSFLQIFLSKPHQLTVKTAQPWNTIKSLLFPTNNCWHRHGDVCSKKSFFSTGFVLNDVPFCNSKLSWEKHFPCLKCDFSAIDGQSSHGRLQQTCGWCSQR